MREERALSFEPRAGYRLDEVDGVLDRLFGFGVRPLQMEDAVFEAVLAGWRPANIRPGRPVTVSLWMMKR